jgi:hypothetical protein
MPTLASGTFTRPVIFRKPPAWCNVRRKFDGIQVATGSPIAAEAIQPIGALYGIVRWLRLFGQVFRFLRGRIVQLVVVVAVGM